MLANVIRNVDTIKGMGENNKIKINLFADDSLLTVINLLESIDWIKIHLEKFGNINRLCVNWQKSELMFNHNKLEQENLLINMILRYLNWLHI